MTGPRPRIAHARRGHSTDLRNQLDEILADTGGGPTSTAYVHDAAGNLVADDLYWYQYDAFNRLASVHLRGTLAFDAAGLPTSGDPGAWKLYMAYDALGRLVSVQKPWSAGSEHRKSYLYYDGVRRIAEVFDEPLQGPGGGIGGVPLSYAVVTDREYVWGPDYVDECLWQVSRTGEVMHVLQDASMDVVATLDSTGAVARQWTYDPYGQPILDEQFLSSAHSRLGHHGLFFDRLDQPAPSVELVSGARGLYHNRNRTYEPRLGRFTSSDPNESALAILSQAVHGKTQAIEFAAFDALGMYVDGANLYGYLGTEPLGSQDAMGLEWDDWWDDTKEGAGVLYNGFETFTSFSDPGGLLGSMLEAMVNNYSMNMESDLDWGMDWSQGDDWHSRGDSAWVQEAMLLGAYKHFNFDYWSGGGSGGPAMASVASTIGKTAPELAHTLKRLRAGMVFDTYNKAKTVKYLKGLGSKWDAHHLLPRSWASKLKLSTNGPAVLLRKQQHQGITTQLNRELKTLKKIKGLNARRAYARQKLEEIYRGQDEWIAAIAEMFN